MEKVFVVIYETACDNDVVRTQKFFHTEKSAKAFYAKELGNAKENAERENFDTKEETETSFSAYDEGYYIDNHVDLWIEEHDFEDETENDDEEVIESAIQNVVDATSNLEAVITNFVEKTPNKGIKFIYCGKDENTDVAGLRVDKQGRLKIVLEDYETSTDDATADFFLEFAFKISTKEYTTECDYSWLELD